MARGRLTFEHQRCKACELCITFCPQGILQLDSGRLNELGYHPVVLKDEQKCTGCAICAIMCPDMIIVVERE